MALKEGRKKPKYKKKKKSYIKIRSVDKSKEEKLLIFFFCIYHPLSPTQ